ncbi:hypothetical protein [Trichormus sp. NMC-1]|uniref:hypothetical protein n=1 Tax=Trichormus sp. NMC-1 TaxID=1853259 RepID=UPI0008DC1EF8|nr:hypothetical protein [Trichormus sp. NMC-1]
MSQTIQFYTITIFSEKFVSEFNEETSPFSLDSIYKCLKELFKGTEKNAKEYRDKYFESVELDISISGTELEQIDKDFTQELQYIFDPETDIFSLVDDKLWFSLQKIIHNKMKVIINGENDENDINKILKFNTEISKDYAKLSELFHKRKLFIALF